ncbi:membrane-bound transcription factor site-1 protease [Drosophila grimshawi]|uniref:Membrane-bound transcription factor site-1 protease n=1 Tax=Drosophila grimshawi TaxID=7222 RepID=B4J1R9_DROGR|nr:membrane-bound transcription factor site-1 protease [Drosophila grimshawi]EDV97999.1 GH14386 [Drosophila grimshawi]
MSAFTFILVITAVFAFLVAECTLEQAKSSTFEQISYQVKNVPKEFIVKFYSKYFSDVRKSFIEARLLKENVLNWSIVSRHNLASFHPSDFDILHISEANGTLIEHILITVKAHPAVKSVVPQRYVQRFLSWNYNDTESFTYNIRHPQGVARDNHLKGVHSQHVSSSLHADVLWKLGITGKGVNVAIFDTGLTQNHPHFRNVKERTNWTNEKSLDDGVSHGTFVAGVIASSKECLGLAPDAELHIYKVFTNSQVSYTSWFLDAFNYAIYKKVNIINLSIGGPDFMDLPFVDKVLELSANNIIMVSSAGNDGPIYGTLNNPGDQSDVIGVGSINFDDKIARFSSRGMTTWELPLGYGRTGLDIVTYGSQVEGSDVRTGCRRLSGTSVSSPVVAGVAALLRSGASHKIDLVNPSSLKQVLIEGAEKLANYNIFEQGQGKLNLLKSMQLLLSYKPKISLIPSSLDFTSNYMWPYSSQPLFYGSTSAIVNVTILNGISVAGKVIGRPKWIPDLHNYGHFLKISTSYSELVWPWTGWMSVYIAVNREGQNYEGISKGRLVLVIESLPLGTNKSHQSEVALPLTIKITPKPPRHKRILWDQFHSLRYPPGYIPRDNLKIKTDPLDWRADHIHTNFRDTYVHLRNAGYYIDVLREPYTCFNPLEYGVLLIVDPEEEFFDEEIMSLEHYVYEKGLSVIVFADWYNTTVMRHIKFFDENSRQWWIPDTGGANIPALNDLLKPFRISFGDFVGEGHFKLGDHAMYYASGTTLVSFPNNEDDVVIGTNLLDQGESIITNGKSTNADSKHHVPIMGLFQTDLSSRLSTKEKFVRNTPVADDDSKMFEMPFDHTILKNRILLNDKSEKLTEGRIAVYGDSNCLDSSHMDKACYWLLTTILDFAMNSHKSMLLENLNGISEFKETNRKPLPMRISSSNLKKFSKVIRYIKNPILRCEELEWMVGTTYNMTKKIELELDSTAGNQYNVIANINSELGKITLNNDKQIADQFDFNIQISVLFMITLTLTVLIVFLLFVKGKFVFHSIK